MRVPDFLSPKLVGKRFDSHSIPLELLGDLAVLEGMLVEVAKWRYLKENPGRKRSPRKFTDGISLTLTAVGEGSAVAKIALTLAASSLLPTFPTEQQTYLEQARDAIVSAIAAASENKSPTDHLPSSALAYFDRLGRSLLQDEAIEFPRCAEAEPARLTKETRQRLLKAAEVNEWTEEIAVRGVVHEMNQKEMSFEILLTDGGKVPGPVSDQHYETILEAFNSYRQGSRVLIDAIGRFNRSNRLQRIESINHVTLLDPLDLPSQLDELRLLKDGWLDGKGVAPTAEGLDWLSRAFHENYAENLPLPYVYPVAEGAVRAEWSLGKNDVSLEIDLTQRTGNWHWLNLKTDEDEARTLDLRAADDWNWIESKLQALAGTVS
ncbi:MAG TPA: hypothetical protein VGM05_30400 [Planctomycetaceae bacterium]